MQTGLEVGDESGTERDSDANGVSASVHSLTTRAERQKAADEEYAAMMEWYVNSKPAQAEPVAAEPKIVEGTTYFVGPDSGPIKIGFASRLEYRLKDLRTMNAFPLVVHATVFGPLTLERAYHQRFAAHRLHGEWFSPHPDILAEIERLNG